MRARFQSLRTRLLIPLAGCSLLAAVAVGAISYLLGDRVVQRSMNSRFEAIRSTLSTATFPLTPTVLRTLAELTGTELASYGRHGQRIEASHPDAPAMLTPAPSAAGGPEFDSQTVRGFRTRRFTRRTSGGDPVSVTHVLVMFDERDLRQSRLAAASLPLATGLSSTLLLSIVAGAMTQRIIHRIAVLQRSVERIAAGEFKNSPTDPGPTDSELLGAELAGFDSTNSAPDELGRLGTAVQRMANELAVLWEAVHRQERQKLIHQIAAGLAHQLRNSLTGARMAVELHARRWPSPDGDALDIAVRELVRTEDYVQRILRIAAQQRLSGDAGTVGEATGSVRDSLQVVADHHHVDLRWSIDEHLVATRVADGVGLTAALENLVLNAIQAGGNAVEIVADRFGGRIRFRVSDNGPGPSETVGGEIFEPFVTTKPEGLGLGLALVRRTAEDLGGDVRWYRSGSHTTFEFVIPPLP